MCTLYFYHLICFVLLPPQMSCIFVTSYTLCCCQIMHFVFLLHHALLVLKDVFCPDITPGWLSMKKQVSSLYFYCIMHFVVLIHHILCVFTTSCTTTCILYDTIHYVFVPHHVLCTTSCIVYFYHIMHCIFYFILHTVYFYHIMHCVFYHIMHCVFLPHYTLCIFTTLHTVLLQIMHCVFLAHHTLCIFRWWNPSCPCSSCPSQAGPPSPRGQSSARCAQATGCWVHRWVCHLYPAREVSMETCPLPHPPLHPNCPWGQNSHCYVQASCCGSIGNNNNNVHLSCAHQHPEHSHDTY